MRPERPVVPYYRNEDGTGNRVWTELSLQTRLKASARRKYRRNTERRDENSEEGAGHRSLSVAAGERRDCPWQQHSHRNKVEEVEKEEKNKAEDDETREENGIKAAAV